MKVAIPIWRDRISPVFDVAGHLLLLDVQEGKEIRREEIAVETLELFARVKQLTELGTNLVICGGISWPLERMLVSTGVRVIPQTCGPVEEVLRAFLAGQLTEQAFLMPGCCGRRRQFRSGRGGQRGQGRGRW